MINIINNLNILNFLDNEKSLIRKKLIYLLFKEISNLHSFCLDSQSDYNDNNYYNSVTLSSVNDIPVERYVGEYYKDDSGNVLDYLLNEEEGEPVADKSKVLSDEELNLVLRVVNSVGESYDYGNHEFKRENYGIEVSSHDSDYKVIKALVENHRQKTNQLEYDPAMVLYCSSMGDKLSKKQEECFKNNMQYAYYYAKYVLKDRLPKELESYLRLNLFKKDFVSDNDKFYLELYNNFASNK
jgi:hypothetical protein